MIKVISIDFVPRLLMGLRNKILSKKEKKQREKKKEKRRETKRSHRKNEPRCKCTARLDRISWNCIGDAKITRPRSRFDRSARLFDRGKVGARKIALKINTLTEYASIFLYYLIVFENQGKQKYRFFTNYIFDFVRTFCI